MKKTFFILLLLSTYLLTAQNGYDIKIKVKNYSGDSLFVFYPYGKNLVALKTIYRDTGNVFILKDEAVIMPGLYHLGKKQHNIKASFIMTPEDCHFSASFDFANKNIMNFDNSEENRLYKKYLVTTSNTKRKIKSYKKQRQLSKIAPLTLKLNNIRKNLIKENPGSVAALLIKSEIQWIDTPYYGQKDSKKIEKQLNFKIDHFLDNLELDNPATMRLPATFRLINEYLDNVVHLKPERVNEKLDSMLNAMGYKSEMFRYYLPYFERKYRFAFRPWVDKTYIHLAKKYYNKDIAYWMKEKEIERVQREAEKREGALVGKIIPDVTLEDENGNKVRLMDIKAPYIVLVFWRPGCGHCRKAMPKLRDFQKEFADTGVKIVTACTRQRSDTYRCWNGVKREKMQCFDYNLADKEGNTGFLFKFNVGGVPYIFILDKDKRILDKKVAPSLLKEKFRAILKEGNKG